MDRRIGKTKKLLKKTLTTLMEEKELRKITVKEITERANINRGTFYLHYQDIYDMVEKLGDEIIIKVMKIIDKSNPIGMNFLFLPVLIKIIEYFYEDNKFISALISLNGDPNFITKITNIMIEYTMETYKKEFVGHSENYIKVVTTFVVSGGIGVFTDWFKDGCKIPINEVIGPCEVIIAKGMNSI